MGSSLNSAGTVRPMQKQKEGSLEVTRKQKAAVSDIFSRAMHTGVMKQLDIFDVISMCLRERSISIISLRFYLRSSPD